MPSMDSGFDAYDVLLLHEFLKKAVEERKKELKKLPRKKASRLPRLMTVQEELDSESVTSSDSQVNVGKDSRSGTSSELVTLPESDSNIYVNIIALLLAILIVSVYKLF